MRSANLLDIVTLGGAYDGVGSSPVEVCGRVAQFVAVGCTIRYDTIRYDTIRDAINVPSKADISQINLPHGTNN